MERVDEAAFLYEDLICKIQGVFSAKVKVDEVDGEIIECHVLADRTRNIKQLVRDVQSALMAKFHVDLDYKLISVAQVDNLDDMIQSKPEEPETGKAEAPRVQLKSFMMGYEGNNIKASVTLGIGGNAYNGEAVASGSASSRFKTLAQAVVNAVNYNADAALTLSVLDVQRFNINGQNAYAVAMYYRCMGREDVLLGSAIIREDENMAVVKAALDALNRRVFTTNFQTGNH